MNRDISFSPEFDQAVLELGGYRAISVVLEAVIEGLLKNPYGFRLFESDFTSVRFVITEAVAETPSLCFYFHVEDNKSVVLDHVEIHDPY
jgi:hypothetical protein